MKIILPTHKPEFSFSPVETSLFATIPLTEDQLPWLFHYYMNIYVLEHSSPVNSYNYIIANLLCQQFVENTSILESCPFILNRIYDPIFVCKDYVTTKEFLTGLLKEGNYIICYVDTQYLDIYLYGIPHPIFIYGYDEEESAFYTADFFDRAYTQKKITYNDLIRATLKMRSKCDLLGDYIKGINAWQVINRNNSFCGGTISFPDTIKIITKRFHEIKDGRFPLCVFKRRFLAAGIGVYSFMAEEISNENFPNKEITTLLKCLFEHSSVLRKCFYYLIAHNVLDSSVAININELVETVKMCMNLHLKIELKGKSDCGTIETIVRKLMNCEQKERSLLEYALEWMENAYVQ